MTSTQPSKRHQWSLEEAPKLDDHGAAKHGILSEYIQKYLSIVCKRHQMRRFNITLIDGFAGGGIYKDNIPGSPLVMIQAVNKAMIDINAGRKNPIDINPDYFFVEKDPDNFASLERTFSNHRDSSRILRIEGDFNQKVDQIINAVKKKNPRGGGGAIFFLDQEGFTSVDIETINKIRRNLPQAEIILTLAISWMTDFIHDADKLIKQVGQLGLRHLNVDEIVHIKENVKDSRNIIESKFSVAIQKSVAFPFFRPFFIEPAGNHRGYWLLHFSPHSRAHNAMTETIWEKGNCMRHYGGTGTEIFEIYYKGGHIDAPSLFGQTFSGEAWDGHRKGLIEHLPEHIWKYDDIEVKDIIGETCNSTAAPPDMYFEALRELIDNREIVISGKSGGKKRSRTISLSDRIGPQRQGYFFKS